MEKIQCANLAKFPILKNVDIAYHIGMLPHPIEAIVLHTIPFQDSHLIATLFTREMGLCKAIGSFSRLPKNALFGSLTPLNHIEIMFRPSKNDLFKIESASILNAYASIRKDYDLLHQACSMLNSLMKFQFPHKPAPILFELLKSYLSLIADSKSPEAILSSFQLKLLRHEGLLSVTDQCRACGATPNEISIEDGRTICATHTTHEKRLTEEETAYFYALSLATSIKLLKEIEIPTTLPPKVAILFEEIRNSQ